MKSLFGLFVGALFFVSCATKEVSTPVVNFYEDVNVAVSSFQMSTVEASINISFSTLYQNNIQKIEIMSSGDNTHFCTRRTFTITSPSSSIQNFEFLDNDIIGTPMYYMLRFQDTEGNWSYSNIYTYEYQF